MSHCDTDDLNDWEEWISERQAEPRTFDEILEEFDDPDSREYDADLPEDDNGRA